MVAVRSRRLRRFDCDSGGDSKRCSRLRRLVVLPTYGSADASVPRKTNTAGTAANCAKKSAGWSVENGMECASNACTCLQTTSAYSVWHSPAEACTTNLTGEEFSFTRFPESISIICGKGAHLITGCFHTAWPWSDL